MLTSIPIVRLSDRLTVGTVVSFLLATMAATATVVPLGTGFAFILTFLAGLICFRSWSLSKEYFIHYWACLFLFVFAVGVMHFHQDGWKSFDIPSRYLLGIPFLLLLAKERLDFALILKGFVVGATLAGIVAAYEVFVIGMHRANGSLFIIFFGCLAAVQSVMCLVAAFYFMREDRFWFWFSTVGILLGVCASVLSGTRGAWVGMIPAFVVVALISGKRLSFRRLFFVCVTATILSVLVYMSVKPVKVQVDKSVQEVALYFGDRKSVGSAGQRFDMWTEAIRSFGHSPIVGLSFKDRQVQLEEQKRLGEYSAVIKGDSSAHSDFFDALAKGGILGVSGYFLLFLLPGWLLFRSMRNADDLTREHKATVAAGFGMLTVYFLSGQTERLLFHHSGNMFYITLMPAICLHSLRLGRTSTES